MVNSIFMTLFGVDFQFQCPREETENAQKALNWILIATLLQNDPFFLFGGGGGSSKVDHVTFFTVFLSGASLSCFHFLS